MKVEFLIFDDEGEASVLETWSLSDGVAVSSDEWSTAYYAQVGIYAGNGPLFPKDGEAFLKGLPVAISGSRMRARIAA